MKQISNGIGVPNVALLLRFVTVDFKNTPNGGVRIQIRMLDVDDGALLAKNPCRP